MSRFLRTKNRSSDLALVGKRLISALGIMRRCSAFRFKYWLLCIANAFCKGRENSIQQLHFNEVLQRAVCKAVIDQAHLTRCWKSKCISIALKWFVSDSHVTRLNFKVFNRLRQKDFNWKECYFKWCAVCNAFKAVAISIQFTCPPASDVFVLQLSHALLFYRRSIEGSPDRKWWYVNVKLNSHRWWHSNEPPSKNYLSTNRNALDMARIIIDTFKIDAESESSSLINWPIH